MTRFLVLMVEEEHFAKWDGADDALRERVFADFRAFTQAVRERGRFRGGEALVHPKQARTLRAAGDGARTVTEGPYAETVEQLGGMYLVELPDLATALEVAALLPREYDIEVRECLDVGVPDE